jgi:uncharacterized protein (UPF0128 family)
MANHILTDEGNYVTAWGMPGSLAHVKCQYPKLIKTLSENKNLEVAIETIESIGINSFMETHNILKAIGFSARKRSPFIRKYLSIMRSIKNY